VRPHHDTARGPGGPCSVAARSNGPDPCHVDALPPADPIISVPGRCWPRRRPRRWCGPAKPGGDQGRRGGAGLAAPPAPGRPGGSGGAVKTIHGSPVGCYRSRAARQAWSSASRGEALGPARHLLIGAGSAISRASLARTSPKPGRSSSTLESPLRTMGQRCLPLNRVPS